jgi:FKBP-type peptidyl-prolyl cis-trans isomerase
VPVSRQRKQNRARKRPRVAPSSSSSPSAQSKTSKSFNYKIVVIILAVAVAASVVAYVVARKSGPAEVTTPSGLKYSDLKVGDGPSPKMGQTVRVHYIGWLENGKEFNNSYKMGQPAEFALGPGLIPGWNEALPTMKVGGKRRLVIPPKLAYGASGRPPNIPPNATLTFEIELLGIK